MPKYIVFSVATAPQDPPPNPLPCGAVISDADDEQAAVSLALKANMIPTADGATIRACDLSATEAFIASTTVELSALAPDPLLASS